MIKITTYDISKDDMPLYVDESNYSGLINQPKYWNKSIYLHQNISHDSKVSSIKST